MKKQTYKGTHMFNHNYAALYPTVTNPVMTDEWKTRLRSIMRKQMIDEVLIDLELPENQHYTND